MKYYISQGRVEAPIRRDGQLCYSSVTNLLQYLYAKNIKIQYGLTKLLQKQQVQLFASQCRQLKTARGHVMSLPRSSICSLQLVRHADSPASMVAQKWTRPPPCWHMNGLARMDSMLTDDHRGSWLAYGQHGAARDVCMGQTDVYGRTTRWTS